jgi:hypothetical protein
VEIALGHPIKLLVNALGTPPKDVVDKVHERGVLVAALCGSVEHAKAARRGRHRRHRRAGLGAGGPHGRGRDDGPHPRRRSTRSRRGPCSPRAGIGCGRQIAAALALGADGAWMGSVWLTTTESDLHPVAVQKLLAASSRDTVRLPVDDREARAPAAGRSGRMRGTIRGVAGHAPRCRSSSC